MLLFSGGFRDLIGGGKGKIIDRKRSVKIEILFIVLLLIFLKCVDFSCWRVLFFG